MNVLSELEGVLMGFVRGGIEALPSVLIASLVLALFVWSSRYIPRLVSAAIGRLTSDPSLDRLARTSARVVFISVGVVIAATVLFPGLGVGDLVGVLGLTSVAVGFAFKDIFQNFLAGIIILAQRPFSIGDQIEADDIEGTIEDINIRSTAVKTFDGQRIIVPNARLFTEAVKVKTAFEARRSVFSTGIGYNEDIEHAREVIHTALRQCRSVLEEPAPAVFVSGHGPSSIDFDIIYWTDAPQSAQRRARDEVATHTKRALDEANIEIPFPQRVLEIANPEALRASSEKREAPCPACASSLQ